jgi:YD repeat-containing protein
MERFNGNVRLVIESRRQVVRGKREKRVSVISEKHFDSKGHLLEERFRRRKHINRITYTYNKRGNCIERCEYDYEHVRFFRYRYKYDKWDNQIEEQCFDPDGSLTQMRTSKFNAAGNEVEKKFRKGETAEVVKYKYNDSGLLLEEHRQVNGKFELRYAYRYDAKGNKIEETFFGQDGTVETILCSYSYDVAGNIVEQQIMNGDGKTVSRYTFLYDAAGHQLQRCQYDASGDFSGSNTSYDANGHKIEERWYNSGSKSCGRTTFKCNDAGLVVDEAMYHGTLDASIQEILLDGNDVVQKVRFVCNDEVLDYQHIHLYNQEGVEIECTETHYGADGRVSQASHRLFTPDGLLKEESLGDEKDYYFYDDEGNWVRKEVFIKGMITEIVERQIEYWKD